MLSATCLLNESRLDLIPILYFDRGYNLEYNIAVADRAALTPMMMLTMTAAAFTPAPRLAPAGSRMAAGDGASLLRMAAASGVTQVDGVRIGPPPDLPSLLLANRIVYIGMPLVPSVTVRRLAAPRRRTLSLLPLPPPP